MPSYKERYARYKKEVDASMGKSLGGWGQFKALFAPNKSFSTARKAAIDQAEQNHLGATTADKQADRLYRPFNLIGTTGTDDAHKTRYYRSSSGTFGHITPFHSPHNVGREPARKHADYHMENVKGRLHEYIGDKLIHPSRNPFVPITDDTQRGQHHAQVAHFDYIKHHGRRDSVIYRHNPMPNIRAEPKDYQQG
ncbi:hypothetical protein [Agarivorans sp. QJM3NY_33]|uniref:hypothetical protein n=1 Tax=Agarivorans sp. QJM3NY_33 TaxID=3421432 RepID=UPI003D7C8DFA